MKRFIDVRDQDIGYNFAWFDTVRNNFESHSDNETWDTWEEFEQDCRDKNDLKRYKRLCPEWVFNS